MAIASEVIRNPLGGGGAVVRVCRLIEVEESATLFPQDTLVGVQEELADSGFEQHQLDRQVPVMRRTNSFKQCFPKWLPTFIEQIRVVSKLVHKLNVTEP
jgi:hypothetical protein